MKLCGEGHSPRTRTIARDDPTAVRFQATTLTWSRCYTESRDALDCVTCHDPHRDASTSPASYEARCLECHARSDGPLALARRPRRSTPEPESRALETCPVNPTSGCIGCHMPAVPGIIPHGTFTDHFIRVHRD